MRRPGRPERPPCDEGCGDCRPPPLRSLAGTDQLRCVRLSERRPATSWPHSSCAGADERRREKSSRNPKGGPSSRRSTTVTPAAVTGWEGDQVGVARRPAPEDLNASPTFIKTQPVRLARTAERAAAVSLKSKSVCHVRVPADSLRRSTWFMLAFHGSSRLTGLRTVSCITATDTRFGPYGCAVSSFPHLWAGRAVPICAPARSGLLWGIGHSSIGSRTAPSGERFRRSPYLVKARHAWSARQGANRSRPPNDCGNQGA
jgi:hypothetical protein